MKAAGYEATVRPGGAAHLGLDGKRIEVTGSLVVDTEGVRLLITQNYHVEIPSPQFEAATLANIDSIIGSTGRLTSEISFVFPIRPVSRRRSCESDSRA